MRGRTRQRPLLLVACRELLESLALVPRPSGRTPLALAQLFPYSLSLSSNFQILSLSLTFFAALVWNVVKYHVTLVYKSDFLHYN